MQDPGQTGSQHPLQPANQNAGETANHNPGPPADQSSGKPNETNSSDVNLQMKDDKLDQDVVDKTNAAPSAAKLEKMAIVAGYDTDMFDGGMLPPPSYDEVMKEKQPERQAVNGLQKLEEEDARVALHTYVSEHCCYGRGVARDLSFKELQQSDAFHYTLETFGEGRSTSWAHEAYKDQEVDGPENGPAPLPWEIEAQPDALFKDQKTNIEVPHTASVKPCHHCSAAGIVTCISCDGCGQTRCSFCSGMGYETAIEGDEGQKQCSFCYGSGTVRCNSCYGTGNVTCGKCNGHRNLKWYIKLTIVWKNHEKDHIVERTGLPVKKIKKASGRVVFEEEQPRVWPLNHFPDPEVNAASQRILKEHSDEFSCEKVLMQVYLEMLENKLLESVK